MTKNLVIVESPAKAKTISKYLGKDFFIKASFGHVRDLPPYTMGVDIEHNFKPKYQTIKGKKDVLSEIKAQAKKAEAVWLATDPDREGEAIAWHVKEGAGIAESKIKRIVFHEITKNAVQNAVKNPGKIDQKLVDAQQARRILDRLIGYKISPVLSRKIRKGLSAGRVQSVALKLICDREHDIQKFVSEEYWTIEGEFKKEGDENIFKAKLFAQETADKKIELKNKEEADKILKDLENSKSKIQNIAKKEQFRNPFPPFITSTLQQEASKKFHWTAKRTMIIAQQLYEGLEIDGESHGLITYMRTDSFRVSQDAQNEASGLISDRFGKNYLPPKPRVYKKSKNIQDAHEAIRPSIISLTPEKVENKLEKDQYKLYRLIWERFIASQMASARVENTQVIISSDEYLFKATGQITLFDGFTKLYIDTKDIHHKDEELTKLPVLAEGDALERTSLESSQHFTQPPPRYTEASLVKMMEEKGIGRPSTYAPTISTILDRDYVIRDKKLLVPTELGLLVDEKLGQYFKNIVDVNFTVEMETHLDEITEGKHVWQEIVRDFFTPFMKDVKIALEKMEKVNLDKPSDEICDKCGGPMVIKMGRYGEFIACKNYPECKNTKPIIVDLHVPCPECGQALLERKSKKGKVFYGCSGFPKCKFASWDKPVKENCPKCKAEILFEKQSKRGGVYKKYCGSCDFESKNEK